MVRTDLRYTYLAKGRYWRFRHPLTGDTKLPGQPGDAAFHARYAELCAAVEQRQKKADPAKTTWHWLILAYQRSAEFRALSDDTQRDYLRTLGILQEELGDWNYRLTTTAMIKAVRDSHADKARKAHKIKQMASALYSWAAGEGHVREGFNPAAPIKQIKRKGGAREYIVWSQYEFEAFLKDGSRPMRLAALLALYTGQRAKDIAAMTWGDVQGDARLIRVRQAKTGAPLDIACHYRLRRHLNALRRRTADTSIEAPLLLSVAGKPYNANALSSAIGRAVNDNEKMPSSRSIHGLRYAAGSAMEEAGCTLGEIQAVLGHHAYAMAMKYATQRLRSREAVARRERNGA
ncbi:site-specific integrase [Sphingomonas sp. DC1100-1]|uniref:site-specific integrase n=1 Tax=unclassified Sphingomonas TaxID=196159 RepID=UPI003CE744A8